MIGVQELTECLQQAAYLSDMKLVQKMLDLGANPRSALQDAAASSTEVLRLILERSACMGESWRLAAREQHNILRGMEWGTANGLSSLKYALSSGMFDILSDDRYIVHGYAARPLAWAIQYSHKDPKYGYEMVRLLLQAGRDPDAVVIETGEGNKSALLLAVETKSLALVRLTLESGAAVNLETKNRVRRTPLQTAAELGCYDIVCFLLEQGADVNAPPARRSGATALQLAASSGNPNIAGELLKRGADMHMKPSILGRWPLEAAAEHGRLGMIDFLWQANSAPFDEAICERAIELAEMNGHEACKDLINEFRMGTTQDDFRDVLGML
jgi:ankyrin repeat protein